MGGAGAAPRGTGGLRSGLRQDLLEQLQQGLLLLGGQGGHPLPVPVKKYLVADGEGLLALFGQVQPVAAALLLFGEEAAFHQLCDAPLRVSPVQVQGPGQLCGSGARVLAYICLLYTSDAADEL